MVRHSGPTMTIRSGDSSKEIIADLEERYLNRIITGKQLKEALASYRGDEYAKQRFKELKKMRRGVLPPPENQPKTLDDLKRERAEEAKKRMEQERVRKAINNYINDKLSDEELKETLTKYFGNEKGLQQFQI